MCMYIYIYVDISSWPTFHRQRSLQIPCLSHLGMSHKGTLWKHHPRKLPGVSPWRWTQPLVEGSRGTVDGTGLMAEDPAFTSWGWLVEIPLFTRYIYTIVKYTPKNRAPGGDKVTRPPWPITWGFGYLPSPKMVSFAEVKKCDLEK